jgi:2-hydroxychromene-2-carboxylate isomerase
VDHPLQPLVELLAERILRVRVAGGFARRLLRAYWAEQGDITDLGQLGQWPAETGIDPEFVKAAAVSEAFKERLDANMQDAIARGVFGVPIVDTGSRLNFGNDRLELLDIHISRG